MEIIKLQGKLTADDYLQASLLNLSHLRGVFILFGLIYGSGFIFMLIANWGLGILLIPYSLPTLILPTLFLLWRYILLPRNTKRIFNQHKDLQSPFTIEFAEDYVIYSNEYGQAKRPWSDYVKFKENDQLFSIYHSDVAMNIIPKRLFSNQEQINSLRIYLSNSIVNKKASSRFRWIIMVLAVIMVIILTIYSFMNQ